MAVINLRMVGALVVGIGLITAAVVFGDRSFADPLEDAVIVADAPRPYTEAKDTDGDGFKDWEEELSGMDPLVPDKMETIIVASTTEPEEVPDTMTSRFAQEFFGEYLEANAQGGMDESYQAEFLEQAVAKAAAETMDQFLTRADINTSADSSTEAIRAYGNLAGEILERYPVQNEHELVILERALEQDSEEELKALDPIIDSYSRTIADLRAVAAPAALAKEHLDLLNTLTAVYNDLLAMRNLFEDALPALVRVRRYEDDIAGLMIAVDNLRKAFEANGIAYTEGERGVFFFGFRP